MANKIKVLIVDDDRFLLDMYCMKFKKSDLEVMGASSGNDALNILNGGFAPAILIMDLVMPGMSGWELLDAVRKGHLADKAVIVVLTNQGQGPDIDKANAENVHGYIVKASTIPSEVVEQVMKIYNTHKV
jgi:CheY-like chemotaxis protein